MVRTLFCLIILSVACFAEPPWGKDSSLIPKERALQRIPTTPLSQVIAFHQHVLSQADGPRSHFYPTSSEYGRQAIERFGPSTGLLLTFDRLMRENGERWVYKTYKLNSQVVRKYDPVPASIPVKYAPTAHPPLYPQGLPLNVE